MKCIVTGGAGFIGSNLVDRLINDGHQVIIFDDLSTGFEENIKRFNFPLTRCRPWDIKGSSTTGRNSR